jgi:hypothetical protein
METINPLHSLQITKEERDPSVPGSSLVLRVAAEAWRRVQLPITVQALLIVLCISPYICVQPLVFPMYSLTLGSNNSMIYQPTFYGQIYSIWMPRNFIAALCLFAFLRSLKHDVSNILYRRVSTIFSIAMAACNFSLQFVYMWSSSVTGKGKYIECGGDQWATIYNVIKWTDFVGLMLLYPTVVVFICTRLLHGDNRRAWVYISFIVAVIVIYFIVFFTVVVPLLPSLSETGRLLLRVVALPALKYLGLGISKWSAKRMTLKTPTDSIYYLIPFIMASSVFERLVVLFIVSTAPFMLFMLSHKLSPRSPSYRYIYSFHSLYCIVLHLLVHSSTDWSSLVLPATYPQF